MFFLVRVIMLLSFCALAILPSIGMAQQPFVICKTVAPPLSLPDDRGMLDRILLEMFNRSNLPVRLVVTPSERGLIEATIGHADGDANRIAGLSRLYPSLIQLNESNMVYEFVAFSKKKLQINSWEDLTPLRVCYITGWKILEENVHSPLVTKVTTPTQLFQMLKYDRAEVVLYEKWGGKHYLNELGIKDAMDIEPPLAKREMYLYLNNKHMDVVPKLEKALQSMKADGTHAAIIAEFQRQ